MSEIHLTEDAYYDLIEFLKDREWDIKNDVEDLGLLKLAFEEMIENNEG